MGLFIFTFILLMNKILKLMDMIINKGVGVGEVTTLVVYLLPSFLVLTLPMSVLLAILICLGKLSGDSEIIAMKASGVSLYQMLPPFAVFSMIGFLLTGLLTMYLLPKGNYAFRTQALTLAKKHSEANLEEGVFSEAFNDMVVYINRFDHEKMKIHGILVSDGRNPNSQNVIAAEYAEILAEESRESLLFRLFNGSIHVLNKKNGNYQYAVFDTYEMNIPLEGMDEKIREIKYREMSLAQLNRAAQERIKQGKSAKKINVEKQQRYAFPFACLVFGLLGLPLGVSWRRGGRSYGFVISIMIVFLYYLLLNIGENLAKSGYLYAFMGMWLPNVLFGGLGVYLFRKIAREQPLPLQWIMPQYVEPALEKCAVWLQQRKRAG